MKRKAIAGLFFTLVLNGCFMSSRTLTSRVVKDKHAAIIYRSKSKSDFVLIEKLINNTCFCADVIAEKYVANRIIYRLYYGCSIYRTRKELYTYCSQGKVFRPQLFDGTQEKGNNYRTQLDATDKFVLHKIDSFIQTANEQSSTFKLCKKEINGFKQVAYSGNVNAE